MRNELLVCAAALVSALEPAGATSNAKEAVSQEVPHIRSSKASQRKFQAEAKLHPQWAERLSCGALEGSSAVEETAAAAGLSSLPPFLQYCQTKKITLENGLEVFLISDPRAPKSSAALGVESGSWDNPPEFPGMAHFVEHLLFMGNKGYPDESDYSRYIVERKGEYNAYTMHDKTIYGFSIGNESFEGAFDRLAHLFVDPLFTPSAIQREMHAVSHEYDDKSETDFLRLWRVLKETGNLDHPNAIFSCGDVRSLGSITEKEVRAWYEKHYIANQMQLVVRSPLDLERLEKLTQEKFSQIPRGEVKENPECYEAPITSERQRGHFIYVKPSYKARGLILTWELSGELSGDEAQAALRLIRKSLAFSGKGSLKASLEKEGLAEDVDVVSWKIEKGHTLFFVDVELTRNGVKQVDTVVERCFQALNHLKEQGIPEYMKEMVRQEVESASAHSGSSFDSIMDMAGDILDEGSETFPQRSYSVCFDETMTERLVNALTPQECVFCFIVDLDEAGVKPHAIERWMGSPYLLREILKEKLEGWNKATAHPEIVIRPKELSRDIIEAADFFAEFDDDYRELQDSDPLVKNAMAQVYFLSEPSSDEVRIYLDISTPFYQTSLRSTVLGYFLFGAIEDCLEKVFPKEDSSAPSWCIDTGDTRFTVGIKSKGEFASGRLEQFILNLKTAMIDREIFEEYKKILPENYPGDPAPLEYAQIIADRHLLSGYYLPAEIFAEIEKLSYEDFVEYAHKFFGQVQLVGEIKGNLDKSTAASYWRRIERTLGAAPYTNAHFEPPQPFFSTEVASGPFLIREKTHWKGNALMLFIDMGELTWENLSLQNILTLLIKEDFFHELRTKEQTGYRVLTWNEDHGDRLIQGFGIQSSTHHPMDLLYRSERFLKEYTEHFEDFITPEKVSAVRSMLMESLRTQMQHEEDELKREELKKELEALFSLSYEDLAHMAKKSFSLDNKKRFAVLVEGSVSSGYHPEMDSDLPYRIYMGKK